MHIYICIYWLLSLVAYMKPRASMLRSFNLSVFKPTLINILMHFVGHESDGLQIIDISSLMQYTIISCCILKNAHMTRNVHKSVISTATVTSQDMDIVIQYYDTACSGI